METRLIAEMLNFVYLRIFEKNHKMTTAYACRWEVQEQLKRIWFAVDVIEGEFSYSDNGNLPSWTFVKSILFVPEIGKQNSATPKF